MELQWTCPSWKGLELPTTFTINFPRKRQIQREFKSEKIIQRPNSKNKAKVSRGWGPAPLDKIFEPGDSEKKTLSGGKMTIHMHQKRPKSRPKTPPILRSGHGSGISFQSSRMVTKENILGRRIQKRKDYRIQKKLSPAQNSRLELNENSFDVSLNKTKSEKGKKEKLMNMVQKIIVKIEEQDQKSHSGKFKFRNRDFGNCFVILPQAPNLLLGVFTEDDFNERLAYNFLEEVEILLVSHQK